MLPRNQRQEALTRAYVRAVAARAGVLYGRTEDDFGFDLFLRAVEVHDQRYWDTGFQLDIQLKSTTRADVRETDVVYDLEVRAYNLLRQDPCIRPRILILLVLPEDEAQWLSHSEDALALHRCAYWMTLRGAAPTTSHTTVRITIPRGNAFSVEALQGLMQHTRWEDNP